MTKNIHLENRLASFPVGYYTLHPDASINFQMNRFYDWVGDPSMLTEMREAGAFAQDYPTFTQIFLELGEKTIAEGNIYKGAAYLRMAEFFLFADDPRKLPTLRRIIKLLLLHHQVTQEQHFRIPYESAWLSAYRFTPPQPKGTLVAFGGFDMSRKLLSSAKEREIPVKRVWTGRQAARGKQGNDLIVHAERFFLGSAHVQVSDLGWLEKGNQHSLCT